MISSAGSILLWIKQIETYPCICKTNKSFKSVETPFFNWSHVWNFISDKPLVSIYPRNSTFIESTKIILNCSSESNPTSKNVTLTHQSRTIKTCLNSTCQYNFTPTRHNSGKYKCNAANIIGNGYAEVDIVVVCKYLRRILFIIV